MEAKQPTAILYAHHLLAAAEEKALRRFLNDRINERLQSAIQDLDQSAAPLPEAANEEIPEPEDDEELVTDKKREIVTTEEEIEAAFIPGDLILKGKKRSYALEERFVRSKIDIDPEHLIARIKERLSLFDETIQLELSDVQSYYSPVLTVAVRISKKDKL